MIIITDFVRIFSHLIVSLSVWMAGSLCSSLSLPLLVSSLFSLFLSFPSYTSFSSVIFNIVFNRLPIFHHSVDMLTFLPQRKKLFTHLAYRFLKIAYLHIYCYIPLIFNGEETYSLCRENYYAICVAS